MKEMISRSQGCFMGQLVGDSLGSLVEFQCPEEILLQYPNGVRYLQNGGVFNTLAGQPTDDSEMAIILARVLVRQGRFDKDCVFEGYQYWLGSGPFDLGDTIYLGLNNQPDPNSQANGAMMRISPLGIFGSNYDLEQVSLWAEQDSDLTHPNPVCKQANALYVMAISHSIRTGIKPPKLYKKIVEWAEQKKVDDSLMSVIKESRVSPPKDYLTNMGWVLVSFQNALWQLLHSENLEEGIVDTIMRGGDTDTNAAITGSLLGSVYGIESFPRRWVDTILNCKPQEGNPKVHCPRPKIFWPNDVFELTEKLINR